MKNMKGFGFFCLFLLTVTAAFVNLCHSQRESTSANPGMVLLGAKFAARAIRSRRLKDNNIDPGSSKLLAHAAGPLSFEDYDPMNPVPTSKTSIRPGPIQHDTPIMPYIPEPSPPPS